MRIQTRLIILIISILAVAIGAFTVLLGFEQNRLQTLFNDRKNDEELIFDRILGLKGQSLQTLVVDYTYWDEMVNFVKTSNMTWVEGMINFDVLKDYHVDAVWILKTDLSLIYSINGPKDERVKDIPFPRNIIKNLFLKEHFCHFFVNTPLGLMEIRGATVHPTADAERKTPAQGYFFSGKLWDNNYIKELAGLTTGGEIRMLPVAGESGRSSAEEGIIAFSRTLTDWDKNPLMRLDISIVAESMKHSYNAAKKEILFLIILAIIGLSLGSFIISHWIGAPLQLISKTLDTENTVYLNKLYKDHSEFGEVSRLIDKFFGQKEQLVNEIAERKKAEEELRISYDKLKQIQAQLIQASKMSGLGSLASGVAHEINNPLTGVLNNVQLIKMSIAQDKNFDPDEFKELLDSMEESAQRCVNITRALLDFGRPSKGVLQNSAIKDMIGRVLILVRHQLEMGDIKITRDIESNLPEIKCDPQLLQQAIFDIISNARWAIQKKSKEEGGIITIKARYNPDKDKVDICISDTGIGIPQENLKRLFEPFFTTKGVGEGAGLGLFMVYNIIKEHKGNIEVESEPNQGTTFKISLPVV